MKNIYNLLTESQLEESFLESRLHIKLSFTDLFSLSFSSGLNSLGLYKIYLKWLLSLLDRTHLELFVFTLSSLTSALKMTAPILTKIDIEHGRLVWFSINRGSPKWIYRTLCLILKDEVKIKIWKIERTQLLIPEAHLKQDPM